MPWFAFMCGYPWTSKMAGKRSPVKTGSRNGEAWAVHTLVTPGLLEIAFASCTAKDTVKTCSNATFNSLWTEKPLRISAACTRAILGWRIDWSILKSTIPRLMPPWQTPTLVLVPFDANSIQEQFPQFTSLNSALFFLTKSQVARKYWLLQPIALRPLAWRGGTTAAHEAWGIKEVLGRFCLKPSNTGDSKPK